ncbi:MAG: hypothetical protein R3190_16405, partial [Thermoanaerobaculia bacterium]|nr:hypothetical protein [Thermoanaerobaculia bacterium]
MAAGERQPVENRQEWSDRVEWRADVLDQADALRQRQFAVLLAAAVALAFGVRGGLGLPWLSAVLDGLVGGGLVGFTIGSALGLPTDEELRRATVRNMFVAAAAAASYFSAQLTLRVVFDLPWWSASLLALIPVAVIQDACGASMEPPDDELTSAAV